MIIPCIDLMDGKVVQLIQGRDKALEGDSPDEMLRKFAAFPEIQVIDLDAALGRGSNDDLVRMLASKAVTRVGGGVRTVARAQALVDQGAHKVIVGTAAFLSRSTTQPAGSIDPPTDQPISLPTDQSISLPPGQSINVGRTPGSARDALVPLFAAQKSHPAINASFLTTLRDAIGRDRILIALDTKAGRIVIKGWQESLDLTAEEVLQSLEPYCGGFLCTYVDKEGMMQGTDLDWFRRLRAATTLELTAAGGITTLDDVRALQAIDVHAALGMAIYTGRLNLADLAALS